MLESTKSKETLQEVKKLHKELIKLKTDTTLWIMNSNDYGTETKRRVTEIFTKFEQLCMINGESGIFLKKPSDIRDKEHFDFHRTSEEFLLFDMPEIKVNKESQRLMRDFGIGEIALFFIK